MRRRGTLTPTVGEDTGAGAAEVDTGAAGEETEGGEQHAAEAILVTEEEFQASEGGPNGQPTEEEIRRALESPLGNDEPVPPSATVATAPGVAPPTVGDAFGSIFAPSQTADTSSDGKARKEPKNPKAKLTPDERAEAGFFGGEYIQQGLDIVSAFFGSTMTVAEFSETMSRPLRKLAAEKGIKLSSGIPIDIVSGGSFPLVQKLSVVFGFDAAAMTWRPVRVAAGVTTLTADEPLVKDQEHPQAGECWVLTIDATVAHAIAYNLADVPSETWRRVVAFVEKNEGTIRLLYAGGLTAGYLAFAFTHRK